MKTQFELFSQLVSSQLDLALEPCTDKPLQVSEETKERHQEALQEAEESNADWLEKFYANSVSGSVMRDYKKGRVKKVRVK